LFAFVLYVGYRAAFDGTHGTAQIADSMHDADVGEAQIHATPPEVGAGHFRTSNIFWVCHRLYHSRTALDCQT